MDTSLIPAALLIATAIMLFAVLSLHVALAPSSPEEAEALVVW
jgi:hypothetical protein